MAQNSVNYSNNPTGPELLDDYLDKEQENILTSNSGIQRPSYADVGTKWLDISSTPWKLMIFDGTNDVIIGSVNPVTHAFTPAGIDTAVLLTGDQSIGGIKTFTVSPQVPTAASGDNSTKAASTAFVTSADNNLQTQINAKANNNAVVHLTGNETISGYKILTGGVTLKSIANMQEGGTYINGNPSVVQRFGTIQFLDSADILRGYTHNYQGTNGDVVTVLNATNTTYSSNLLVGVKQNGTSYVKAPASDEVNSVVTTINKSKSENGYFKLGNGLIIQWGHSSIDGNQVTLPTPFSNTNYRICATYMKASGNLGSGYGHVVTYPTYTTSFYANTEAGEYQWIAIGY
ncbi:MAG: hypothetical protein IJ529_02155 [Alphaproteobacteria bacterium]|nr:hypothetical protein [Alphaproteobacteria bacterium]MBR1599985.1 hypothetical protein [Alphaproteobacteria bacterium]